MLFEYRLGISCCDVFFLFFFPFYDFDIHRHATVFFNNTIV